jgi:hypothetical protein
LGCTGKLLNSSTRGVFLAQVTAHHFYIGIVFITSSVIGFRVTLRCARPEVAIANVINSWDAQLSINLAIAASLSIAFAHHMYAIPIYPYCASDYPTQLCLFYHHMWIGAFLIIGSTAHASIFIIADEYSKNYSSSFILLKEGIKPSRCNYWSSYLGYYSFRVTFF